MEVGGSDSEGETSGMLRPTLVQDIRGILDQYPDNGQILKELIQNADDAGASCMTILFDQNGPEENMSFPHFQGPALYVYNDAVFTEDDWLGIKMLRNSLKAKDPLKVGRFGLGFKSVFHLTDYPSIVSGDTLMLIDPSQPEEEVFSTYSLSKRKRTIKAMAQTLAPVLAVLSVGSERFLQGTLFRFPLRQTVSDLSPLTHNKENILDLLDCSHLDMTLVLLFLKSLESVKIETFSIPETIHELIFSVSLCKTNSARKTYRGTIETALKSQCSFSCTEDVECLVEDKEISYILRCKVNNTFVGQDRASQQLSKLSHDPELSYCPLVGVAYVDPDHLQRCPSLRGHVFCFLPLPLQSSSCTGFPLLINGFFALNQERHHLKWPTTDEEIKGWGKQTDVACLWNRCLLTEALPYAYGELLCGLRADAVKGNNSDEDIGRYYQSFPCMASVTGIWHCLADSLYDDVLKTGLFFTRCDGGKWVSLTEAIICSVDADSSPETQVCETLVQLKENVCLVPQHVSKALRHYADKEQMAVTWLSPQLVRTILRKKSGYKKVEPHTKQAILLYVLSDLHGDTSELHGLELLPLANGGYTEFQACIGGSCVYVATHSFPPSLLPHLGEMFLAHLQGDLASKMEWLCQTGGTQLRHTQKEDIPGLVSKELLTKWESHESRKWLISVWSVLGSHFKDDLSKFEGFNIIPVVCGTVFETRPLMCLSHLILKQSRAGELSDSVEVVLGQLGVELIHDVPDEVLQHPQILDRYIHDSTCGSVLKAILSAQQLSRPVLSPLQITEKETMEFVSLLVMCGKHSSPEEAQVLRTLELFNCELPDGSSKRVSLNEVCLAESKQKIPVTFCRPVLKFQSEDERQLAKQLGAKEMKHEEMIIEVLKQMQSGNETYQPIQIRLFLLFLCEHNLMKNDSILLSTKSIAFLSSKGDPAGRELKKTCDLFDPSFKELADLFDAEDVFPEEKFQEYLPQLQALGLKTPKDISVCDLLTTAIKLQSMEEEGIFSAEQLKRKSDTLVHQLVNISELSSDVTCQFQDIKFICCDQRPHLFPERFPWFPGPRVLYCPSMLASNKLGQLVGSVMPVFRLTEQRNTEITEDDISKKLGLVSEPPLEKVVQQLKILISCLENGYDDFLLMVVKNLYKELNRHLVPLVIQQLKLQELFDSEWIWNGRTFVQCTEIYVQQSMEDILLEPHRFPLPKDMQPLEDMFHALGCHKRQDNHVLLEVLHKLKTEQAKQKACGQKDLELVMNILHALAKNYSSEITDPSMAESILLPVECECSEFQLSPAGKCTYVDSSQLFQAEDMIQEEEEIYILHQGVPHDLAKSFGVNSLMDKLLDTQAIDLNFGQVEPLTRRLRNLLNQYTDGMSVIKELIQNADDAKAGKVCFLYDQRKNKNARKRLFHKNMADCQGPALWAYNNAEFSKEDFMNITKVGGATKEKDSTMIGKFGLGFNAVYNLTDVPSFVSRDQFVVFDPHKSYLGKPGLRLDIVKNRKMMTQIADQFQPFSGLFGCDLTENNPSPFNGTLFRFPLRTKEQAMRSEISELHYSDNEMLELLNLCSECVGNLLLFTQHVKEMEFYYVPDSNQEAPQPKLLFKTDRSVFPEDILSMGQVTVSPVQAFHMEQSQESTFQAGTERRNSSELTQRVTITVEVDQEECNRLGFSSTTSQQNKVTWLTSWSTGNERTNEFQGARTLPIGSVAVPITPIDEQTLRVSRLAENPPGFLKSSCLYTYLPMPLPINLPVIVNGSFCVTQDRRHLQVKTVDDKKSQGSEWNESLLQDSVAHAYIDLLLCLRDYTTTKSDLFEFWPTVGSCEDSLTALTSGFYSSLASQHPEILAGKDRWCCLQEAVFLEEDLQNHASGIGLVAFDVLHKVLQDTVAVKPLQSVRDSLNQLNIHHNVMTTEEFYKLAFLPNINNVDSASRDELVLFALRDPNLKQLVNTLKCIPVDPVGNELRSISELVHPYMKLSVLFDKTDKRFPHERFCESDILKQLMHFGMMADTLPPEMILDRICSVEQLSISDPTAAVERFGHLLKVLEHMNSEGTFLLSETHKRSIRETPFIPTLQRPAPWPASLTWNGDEAQFGRPKDLVCRELYFIVGTTKLVSNSTSLVLKELGVTFSAKPQDVVEHLKCLSQIKTDQLQMDQHNCLSEMFEKTYNFIEMSCKEDETMAEFEDYIHDIHNVFIDYHLVDVHRVSKSHKYGCQPYLYTLPVTYHWKYPQTMRLLGVKDRFQSCDVVQTLVEFYTQTGSDLLADTDINLLNQLLLTLLEANEQGWDNVDMNSVRLPDISGKLCQIDRLCFDDCPWIMCFEEVQIVHEKISKEMARLLGVRTKQDWFAQESSEEMPFGQKEELTTRLKGLLHGYPCDETILKELVQNADDAGATDICFIKDQRNHEDEQVFCEKWKSLQGPALCVFNNKPFTEKDIKGIQSLGQGNKQGDPLKTGQYGVGFNCVYHLTDVPSFITTTESGETLCVFDPNQQYVYSSTCGKRYKLPQTRNRFPHVFSCYPDELLEQNGTLFRFPLRTPEMANTSKLKEKPFHVEDLDNLMESFKTEAKETLLFTKNIKTIRIMNTLPDGKFEEIYEIQAEVECDSLVQHQGFVEHLSHTAMSLQSGSKLQDVDSKEVEYVVNLKYGEGAEKWYVRKRIGFEEPARIPDQIKEAYNDGQIGCLPTGGIAFPLSMEDRPCRAYRCMPLPIETGLPAAVDGHFTLDHENRRNLYSSTHDDLGTVWNRTLVKLLLAPLYGSCLVSLKQILFSQFEVIGALDKFHRLFPQRSKTGEIWNELCMSVYHYLDKTSAPVLPVLRNTKKDVFVQRWLPPTGELANEAYFDILAEQCDTKLGQHSKEFSSKIRGILDKLDFNLVATPLDVMDCFILANVQVKTVQPDIVLTFLKHIPSNPSGLKLGNLPMCIRKTPIQTKSNLLQLLQYCQISDKIKELEGLPFQLTCSGQLNLFSETGIFYSRHYKILPASADRFLDCSVGHSLGLNENCLPSPFVVPFKISDFVSLLPLEGSQLVCATHHPVEWNSSDQQSRQWITDIWKFLSAEIKHKAYYVTSCLQQLEPWSLIPVSRTLNGSRHYFLAPVSYADQILFSDHEKVCSALKNMGMFVFEMLSNFEWRQSEVEIFQKLLVSPTALAPVLLAATRMLQHQVHHVTTTASRDVLSFFNDQIETMQPVQDCKASLRGLPFFLTKSGQLVSLSSKRGIVLPKRIPPDGLNEWSRSLGLVLLEEDSRLSSLYHFLGLNENTDLDFYCDNILQFFRHLDDMSQKRHLEFIRDNLIHKATVASQLSRLQTVLQQLAFIPHQGCLKKASEFYDHNNEILQGMLEDNHFVPASFKKKCWYDFLKASGLVMEIKGELYLQLALQLEEEAMNTEIDEEILSKSQMLVKLLFRGIWKDEDLLKRIRNVKFLVSSPVLTLEQLAPLAVPAGRMMSFSGSILPTHASLVWTIWGILPEYSVPHLHHNTTSVCKALGIMEMPTSKDVICNVLNVSRELMKDNFLQTDKVTDLAKLISVLSGMYDFLQKQELSSSELKDLGQSESILIPNHRCFVRPSLVVEELDTRKEIPPYLLRLPLEFGLYASLFRKVGTQQHECPEHYASVLSTIKKCAVEKPLHPNEIDACLKSIKELYQMLKNSESDKQISELYLPVTKDENKTIVLVSSRDVVISDRFDFESRLRSFPLNFLIDLHEIKIDRLDLLTVIPEVYKPQLLSHVVKKQLTTECEKDKQQSDECIKIQTALSDSDFVPSLIRILKHFSPNLDNFGEKHASKIRSIMTGLQIFVVPKITTHLVYEDNIIPDSQSDSRKTHTQRSMLDGEHEIHVVLCQEFLIKKGAELFTLIGKEVCHLLSFLNVNEVSMYIPAMLEKAYRNESVQSYLDEMDIRSYLTHEDYGLKPSRPPPGSYVPLEMHCMLDATFSFFEAEEYVGYEIWDPMLNEEEGDPVYIYVKVLKEVEGEHDHKEMSWQKKYKVVLNGDGETAVVMAIDLYKLSRKPHATSMAVECYVGSNNLIDNSTSDDKTLQEVKHELFKMLKAAWTDEANRRKVLKRLLLMWHPDKNIGREPFCTEVTQYILKLVERFEAGKFDQPADENIHNRSGYSSRPRRSRPTWFSEFYKRTRTRGNQYGSDFKGFSSDTTDGRTPHHGSTSSHYSSRNSTNPQPSEGRRWFRQAEADYRSIGNDQQTPTWACFKAQQVAEKAMKAVIYSRDANNFLLRSHSLSNIAGVLNDFGISEFAKELEALIGRQGYVRTRYPDMVHGPSIPEEVYTESQATSAGRLAQAILEAVRRTLG